MAQGDIFQTDLALHEEGCLRDQATWLARYSEVCPELRAFTFPDGTRWARVKDRWIP
ncbi:hypothetical protein M407DRAFT_242446 [Tulasnella calospora MUT 4182]|uniref:Uncharacterized protein n=1 Tax=Tulasnella calospora MUT 4182 TaxID=1051891 RepID=A0A0C3QQQ8_9AGAM|nr:hypothetical protein M407DRAFT_242446 [Tulasnella calospora MUT 4182]